MYIPGNLLSEVCKIKIKKVSMLIFLTFSWSLYIVNNSFYLLISPVNLSGCNYNSNRHTDYGRQPSNNNSNTRTHTHTHTKMPIPSSVEHSCGAVHPRVTPNTPVTLHTLTHTTMLSPHQFTALWVKPWRCNRTVSISESHWYCNE